MESSETFENVNSTELPPAAMQSRASSANIEFVSASREDTEHSEVGRSRNSSTCDPINAALGAFHVTY